MEVVHFTCLLWFVYKLNSLLFATVPFTLANKRRRYVPALCELDLKKEGVRGVGGGSEKSGCEKRRA